MQARGQNARISRIAIAPVKGLALTLPAEVLVGPHGVAENRRLHLVDETGRLINDKTAPRLMLVAADLDLEARTLSLRFPDGGEVAGELAVGEPATTSFYGRPVVGRMLRGPWARMLSDWAGLELRLVMSDDPGAATDRGPQAGVTLISAASIDDVARAGGAHTLDGRRFRMLFEIDGVEAYAEEAWIDRDVRIGEVVVRPRGNVGRCVITTCDPDTATQDFDTLGVLARHRKDIATSERLPLGVVGAVVTPGRVRVGDAVQPL